MLRIIGGGLEDPRVVHLLNLHLVTARAQTAREALTHWTCRA
jgi:hypothetical protein